MRLLASFHYFRQRDVQEDFGKLLVTPGSTVFGDSGAFSALHAGAEVTVKDYAGWLLRWKGFLTHYVTMDVIGDAAASLRNLRELESYGLKPMPVVHAGEAITVMESYCERYPWVALGGLVRGDKAHTMRWMVEMFKVARKHGTKIHGFGNTQVEATKMLPFDSVDSSSWMMGGRSGAVNLWDFRRHTFVKVTAGSHAARQHHELIREHGVDPDLLCRPHAGRSMQRTRDRATYREEQDALFVAGAAAYLRMESYLRRRHGKPVAVYLAAMPDKVVRISAHADVLLDMERKLNGLASV